MPRQLILSTVGTSLLTNANPNLRPLLGQTANLKDGELSVEQREAIDAALAASRQRLRDAEPTAIPRLGAELNGICRLYRGDPAPPAGAAPDHHMLICTDTVQGSAIGETIRDWLLGRGFSAEARVVQDLSTRGLETFRSALSDLARLCGDEVADYRAAGYRIVFNLTGGFKSVNGFMQALGMFHADECVYVFETQAELLSLPRLPIVLDPEGIVGRHLEAFRRLAHGHELPAAECGDIPETLLVQVGDRVALSEWGEAVWSGCRDRYYRDDLQPPLSPRLRFADRFEKAAATLPPDRRVILNRRLDDLAKCLDGGANPKSLSLKELQGKPVHGSTHEFYAWSDRDAPRCFGHFEDGEAIFIVDRLDDHL